MTENLQKPPLVVLTSVDDWRFDAANYQPDRRYWRALPVPERLETPNIDAFANDAVRFEKCVSTAGYTPIAHATMFTGTYARRHGVVDFARTRCRSNVPTVSEAFANAGYRTVLLADWAQPLFCDANQSLRAVHHRVRTLDELRALLFDTPWQPTFLVTHFFELHAPLVLATDDSADKWETRLFSRLLFNARLEKVERIPTFRTVDGQEVTYWQAVSTNFRPNDRESILNHLRMMFNAYLHMIEKFDATTFATYLGLLKSLPQWPDAVMVVTSDHGEVQQRYEPWKIAHGACLEELLVRVPLLIRAPRLEPRSVSALVGTVDIVPTLLELAGLDPAQVGCTDGFDGRSLVDVCCGAPNPTPYYWIEGWAYDAETKKRPSTITARAIRYPDGRKYAHYGDSARWSQIDEMSLAEYADFLKREVSGFCATPEFERQIEQQLRQTSRQELWQTLRSRYRPPFYIVDNVDDDITETNATLVDPNHPRWPEFAAELRRMYEHTGVPNETSALSQEEEAAMLERLAELGYVEQPA
ncbi:MAG: sulfatase-like hydrolase/transferase [Phycisphaerae bacterium]